WLADSTAKYDRQTAPEPLAEQLSTAKSSGGRVRTSSSTKSVSAKEAKNAKAPKNAATGRSSKKKDSALDEVKGAVKQPMPRQIHPMLATLVGAAFDDPDWLYEIKWDGYRSVVFFGEDGKRSVRMVSRNQNDQTKDFPELQSIADQLRCRNCIVDGEIVAADESGRASFSLMQQRSGLSGNGKRRSPDRSVFILYYAFDVLYLDGYSLVVFFGEDGKRSVRMVSRNQNDQTKDFPELQSIADQLRCRNCIVDGEIVAADESGRASFSLMQQRSGLSGNGKRRSPDRSVFILYYAFDVLYLDGYSLMKVDLENRKKLLARVVQPNERVKVSEHFPGDGRTLLEAARQQGLEGIVAKRRKSCYIQKRSREWLKIKITQRQECVIGGYTDPRGSRENFGSLVLGLYDDKGRLIPVGQAGSGFTQASHAQMWEKLRKLETKQNPFYGKIDSPRSVHFVKPALVAEIKFTEWTHETGEGGIKMRAPIYQGLRTDKDPRECRFEVKKSAQEEVAKAESGDVA
ncbi:MAG: hypothetical protein DMG61_07590, partial [Acidobacteria bacterium]